MLARNDKKKRPIKKIILELINSFTMKYFIYAFLLPTLSFAQPNKGIMLQDLTWLEAEKILTPETIVVIPLGAASKEHGPHLLLKNDLILAEYFQARVLKDANVVIAPMINYHFYPSFLEYPGSTSLRLETARDVVVDICRSLAHYAPLNFIFLILASALCAH